MQIELSGHHVEITDGIRQAVSSKLSKIETHYPQLDSLAVILTVEPNVQIVDISTQYLGSAVAVQASDKEAYSAIAAAAKKLESALAHKKGARQANRHERPELDTGLAAE